MIDRIHFIAALKCTWIRRMYVNHDANWVYSAKPYIVSPTNLVMLGPEYAKSVARKCTNKFWSQVLYAWGKLQSRIQMNSINSALNFMNAFALFFSWHLCIFVCYLLYRGHREGCKLSY